MKKRLFLFFLFLFFNMPSFLKAQETTTISLRNGIEILLKENHGLKATQFLIKAEQDNYSAALSSMNPVVSLQETAGATNNPAYVFMDKLEQQSFGIGDLLGAPNTFNFPSPRFNFQSSLVISKPLFDDQAIANQHIAYDNWLQQKLLYQKLQKDKVFQFLQLWLNLKAAHLEEKFAQEDVDDAKLHFEITKSRYQSGLGLYSDKLRAKADWLKSKQYLNAVKTNIAILEENIGILLGYNNPVDIKGNSISWDLNDLSRYTQAIDQTLKIQIQNLKAQKTTDEIKSLEAQKHPRVFFNASYDLYDHRFPFGNEGSSWQVALVAQWNIFGGGQNPHRIHAEENQVESLIEQVKDLKSQRLSQIYSSYFQAKEGLKNIDLRQAELKSSLEALRIVRLRYQNGFSTFSDLYDALLAVDEARLNLVKTQVQYWNSILSLNYLSENLFHWLNFSLGEAQ